MRRKKKSAAISKYCKDKHGRNAPAVFGWTIHLRKFNSWDVLQDARRIKSVAILKYGEDKQRRNRPLCSWILNTPQKIQLLGCSARRFPEQYSSIARTSNAAIVPLCFWILNTPQKIQLLGCSARRFPEQYSSIARTSNAAMRPSVEFNERVLKRVR